MSCSTFLLELVPNKLYRTTKELYVVPTSQCPGPGQPYLARRLQKGAKVLMVARRNLIPKNPQHSKWDWEWELVDDTCEPCRADESDLLFSLEEW